ncbi:XPB/Ssl2-like helicase family protein [Brevibacterium sanguinis]|uniref:XPB/Ssl2-like helicase family protein n=2 Tax=Brevibacterium TaxID=1696 RepID=A0A366IJ21_9MICO|nr:MULTISPECIES: helicase-associated domain-containing protein [Brevibacterium]RBP65517.1 XPB/Ssl2-like helicase family protein [Brevibacterium sanguinis]RBP72151.1 XPB/Ssl2-like helicase family protein [Brevibacterium celere]
MPMTFSTWLAQCPEPDFESFVRTRRDLLRPEAPTIAALAAAASSRIGVSRGIEALRAAELDVAIALATAARTSSDIAVSENSHIDAALAEAVLPRLRDLGLAWPSSESPSSAEVLSPAVAPAEVDSPTGSAAPSPSPDGMPSRTTPAADRSALAAHPVWRIQSEAITLLPTSAAESVRAHPWRSPARGVDDTAEAIPQSLIHNGEQAAVAEVISSLRGLVDELAASPVSRLTSGGISKRDVSRLARTIDLGLEQTITLLLAAKSLRLIGVLDDPLDPQWTAADTAAEALEGDRGELWARLVTTWLRESQDVTQLIAGSSANERLTVLATPKKALFKGFAQSVPAMPLLRLTVLEVLHDIGLGSSRSAAWIHAQVLDRHPLIPAHEFRITEQVLRTAVTLGLATTPLKSPDRFGPSRFGAMLAAGVTRAMDEEIGEDPSIAPLGFSLDRLQVTAEVTAAVRDGLVEEVDSVLIQSDLTAVATGPIQPRVHHILRRYAVVEARGQGTVYRIDADTVEASLQSGVDPHDALAELAEISAEALPSTLEFLITNTAARLHRVRVAGARAVLVVDDPVDLDVILSDPLMLPAALERLAPTVAVSQIGPERTMHLLESADHHALLHAPEGAPRRRSVITASEPEVHVRRRARVTDADLGEYIRILRSPDSRRTRAHTEEPLGHMDRLREAATQGQMVRIRLADSHGQERVIEMLPATVNGGRVRGRVTTTGAEASLSIARIVSVELAEASA